MPKISLPSHLQNVFFDTLWDRTKLWSLKTPTSTLPLATLTWLLDLSVWSTVAGEPRFDLAPRTVLCDPSKYSEHWTKICGVGLEFPLDLFLKQDRWVVVDGYHRLAKHFLQATPLVPVRLHPATSWTQVHPDGV